MRTAVLIIAHGGGPAGSADAASFHAECIMKQTGLEVRRAYLHSQPGIAEEASAMAADGIERIVALPLFMTDGYLPDKVVRMKLGLPPGAMSGRVAGGGKEAEIVFTGTFGGRQKMRTVLVQMCDDNGASPDRTSILLVFHGSDGGEGVPCAEPCAGYLRERGYRTEVAYNEFQSPGVEEALSSLMRAGKDILVIPMFVSPGKHTTDDIPGKLGLEGSARSRSFETAGGSRRIVYAREIGICPGVTYILKDLISEALDRRISSTPSRLPRQRPASSAIYVAECRGGYVPGSIVRKSTASYI